MNRSAYSDDLDPWALIRWRGAVAAAIRGTRGQELLHGLAVALDTMAEKRLIAHALVTDDGSVCALGALGVCLGRRQELSSLDPGAYEEVAQFFGVAEALVREIEFINDSGRYGAESETQRWERVRAWVREHILAAQQTGSKPPALKEG